MSEFVDERRECESFADDLAVVALGTSSGRRREDVLAHVERCPSCSAELEQLSVVADRVLELAPEVEPPVGFEWRLARRLKSDARSRRPATRRRVSVIALAAAVALVLGFGLGLLVSNSSPTAPVPSARARPTEASLRSHGHAVGDVIVSSGATPWMIMTVDSGWWSGAVTCEAVLAGGKVETIGTFRLSGGYGTWGAPLRAPWGQVRGARLVASDGVVLASASL
jgi:hypothetical protein